MKLIHVVIDGSPLVLGGGGEREGGEGVVEEEERRRGFLVRRAPGHVQYDFAQDILFDQPTSQWTQEAPCDLPRGCILAQV